MSAAPHSERFWQPSTFLERGVAMPFTTPVLAGARARPSDRGLELIVPQPAGVRGIYIMAWAELRNFCAPTLHDVMLSGRIASLKTVTPREIRRVARTVVVEGAAGRGAQSAAVAADDSDRLDGMMTSVQMLQMLVQQTTGAIPPPALLDRQAKAAIVTLANATGRPSATITNDIEALASLYAGLGVGATASRGRCARVVAAIDRTAADLRPVTGAHPGSTALAAALVVAAAEVTLKLARRALTDAQARADDLPLLLSNWAANSAEVAAMLTRPEWLLDGWEQICLIWHVTERGQRRAAINEMALMVPAIPQEANEWWQGALSDLAQQRLGKLVQGYEDWRTGGMVFELVARNERILALACAREAA